MKIFRSIVMLFFHCFNLFSDRTFLKDLQNYIIYLDWQKYIFPLIFSIFATDFKTIDNIFQLNISMQWKAIS